MLNSRLNETALSTLGNLTKSLCLLSLVMMLFACAPTLKIGNPPNIATLHKLESGVSTRADVLQVLGEPRGTGAGHFSSEMPYHDGWYYEYLEAKQSIFGSVKTELKMLLVFFLKGRYDGHLWFSSASLLNRVSISNTIPAQYWPAN